MCKCVYDKCWLEDYIRAFKQIKKKREKKQIPPDCEQTKVNLFLKQNHQLMCNLSHILNSTVFLFDY